MARLPVNVLPLIVHDTPMLLSAPPLAQRPPVKVLRTTLTGRLRYWLSARTAAPPTSGPVRSQRLPTKRASTMVSRPPRTKIAPPPPPSTVWPVELPEANVMLRTTRRGVAWSWQWSVVQTCARSQVFWYRILRTPWPLSVTRPPPSSTSDGLVLRTLAVWRIRIVTGAGPQSNVTTPPRATAETTAADVQLAGVPLPTWAAWATPAGASMRRAARAQGRRIVMRTSYDRPPPRPGSLSSPGFDDHDSEGAA